MKKNGFTLVELLAVIVILAIIALIAVPVFLGIINKAKSNSDKEGVNLYTDTAEKAIQKKQMSDPNFQPDKCTIKENGNLECFNGTTSLGTVKVTMKGTKPTAGTILIEEDEITYKNIVLNGKTYYEAETSYATLITDAAPTGLSVGDKYTYKVNGTDIFSFYILSINNDNVNLIMDRNICEDGTITYTDDNHYCQTEWEENQTYTNGPVTAMQYLYNATKEWTNVTSINFTYDDSENDNSGDYGYTGITTNNGVATITGKNGSPATTIGTTSKQLKARLPMYSEVTSVECSNDYGSCPVWLVDNLAAGDGPCSICSTKYASSTKQSNIYNYWLLKSYSDSASVAYVVSNRGGVQTSNPSGYISGIRPVITVSKSDL